MIALSARKLAACYRSTSPDFAAMEWSCEGETASTPRVAGEDRRS